MISVASTAWEVVSLVGVFVLGLALTSKLGKWFGLPVKYGILIYLWHTSFCVLYIFYSMSNPADSLVYFVRSLTWNQFPTIGTNFVIAFTSLFTQDLGFSYGGTFFIYNIIGTAGLIAFSASLRETLRGTSRRVRWAVTILPFLPSFSFWSTAIGKDSLAFFGIGLVCWTTASPFKRYPAMVIGVLALFAVRPHMAGILLICLSFAFLLAKEGSLWSKLLLNAVALPFSASVIVVALGYLGLGEDISVDQLTTYMEQRQSYNLEGGSSIDIAQASVPARIFTYLFRPLFFETYGMFGFVVSIENLILLGAFVAFCLNLIWRRSCLSRFQRVFCFLYIATSWLVLANVTANLGIAIRQKTMFTPMLLLLMLSYLPYARRAVAHRRGAHPMPIPQYAEQVANRVG